MPTKKKKAFTKKNSVKFLLLHGHDKAVNADGETLDNVLVPVSRNYKPGNSLIMPKIIELVNQSNPPGASCNTDLQKIVGQFDDVSDDECEQKKEKLGTVHINNHVNKLNEGDIRVIEEFEDFSSDFSDADTDISDSPDVHENSSFKQNCPESLKILEERLEKKLEEYEDYHFGALDDEEICGYLTGENERVNHFLDQSKKHDEEEIEIGKCDESLKEFILKYSEEDRVENIVEIVSKKPVEFDCESIISTYSNKYNHPVIIKEEKISKIRIPNNPLKKQLTKSNLKQLDHVSENDNSDDDDFSIASTMNTRPKGETPEQRKERKTLFKEARRESRILKKENKIAFKNEKKLQKAQAMNIQNTRCISLH